MAAKKKTSRINRNTLAAENQQEFRHVIAKTDYDFDWELDIAHDYLSTQSVWMERKNVTIDKTFGAIPDIGYWFSRAKLTKTTQPDLYEVAVALGIFYFSKPSVFTAFSFTALNNDGFNFFTGGTFLFNAENSMRYRLCDGLPRNPSEVCLTPYFLFPEPVRITESLSLKLSVKIYPQIVFDQEYIKRLRQFQLWIPHNKFGFHSSLPNRVVNDFVMRVNCRDIPCHKSILSCRSPFFATMFHPYAFKEVFYDRCESMEATDFDFESVKMMVDFMYTSDVPELTIDSAKKLLNIADRFQVIDLKRVCEEFLNTEICRLSKVKYFRDLDEKIMQKLEVVVNDIKTREAFTVQSAMMFLNLTKIFPVESVKLDCEEFLMAAIDESNVFEILIKADCCRALKLKIKAIDFVRKNFMELTMDQYDKLIKERPHLFKDILMTIAANW